jgi:hypothetical protein
MSELSRIVTYAIKRVCDTLVPLLLGLVFGVIMEFALVIFGPSQATLKLSERHYAAFNLQLDLIDAFYLPPPRSEHKLLIHEPMDREFQSRIRNAAKRRSEMKRNPVQ